MTGSIMSRGTAFKVLERVAGESIYMSNNGHRYGAI